MAKAEAGTEKKQVQTVDLPEVASNGSDGGGGQIDILLDMDVPVVVALGETEIPVRRLLQLGPGSVLELDKAIDAPADLYLRGTKFAEGEIVVVDEHFGIRIERILGIPSDASADAS